jgi:SOCE-associated regulatory factor of calcium homoeostasis
MFVWFGVLAFLVYCFLKSYSRTDPTHTASSSSSHPDFRPGGGGWFPGGHQDPPSYPPPPPYPKGPEEPSRRPWEPGFWSGAALGSLGTYLATNRRRTEPASVTFDNRFVGRPRSSGRRSSWDSDDKGEGSSNLGSMRRSTGFGGTNVR